MSLLSLVLFDALDALEAVLLFDEREQAIVVGCRNDNTMYSGYRHQAQSCSFLEAL